MTDDRNQYEPSPLGKAKPADLVIDKKAHDAAMAEVQRLVAEIRAEEAKPNLGLASTRELLEELLARGENVGDFPGERLASRADGLLRYLPDALLDYRAVDS